MYAPTRTQKPLSASSCGFDSQCWHQNCPVHNRLVGTRADRREATGAILPASDHPSSGRSFVLHKGL
jgi:hypothetical protein